MTPRCMRSFILPSFQSCRPSSHWSRMSLPLLTSFTVSIRVIHVYTMCQLGSSAHISALNKLCAAMFISSVFLMYKTFFKYKKTRQVCLLLCLTAITRLRQNVQYFILFFILFWLSKISWSFKLILYEAVKLLFSPQGSFPQITVRKKMNCI